jgi:hypothetical protein
MASPPPHCPHPEGVVKGDDGVLRIAVKPGVEIPAVLPFKTGLDGYTMVTLGASAAKFFPESRLEPGDIGYGESGGYLPSETGFKLLDTDPVLLETLRVWFEMNQPTGICVSFKKVVVFDERSDENDHWFAWFENGLV